MYISALTQSGQWNIILANIGFTLQQIHFESAVRPQKNVHLTECSEQILLTISKAKLPIVT